MRIFYSIYQLLFAIGFILVFDDVRFSAVGSRTNSLAISIEFGLPELIGSIVISHNPIWLIIKILNNDFLSFLKVLPYRLSESKIAITNA